ncbi:Helicase associated domain protein [Streptomyces barkulensis]|uniref:Helicase associated domain protein n=1 Tax=Streptomyces barkulensis TaxID=1257026 RepID=UPI00117C1EC7
MNAWTELSEEQQRRLTTLGIKPLEETSPAPAANRAAKSPSKAQQAFQRGLAALTQWIEREGAHRPVPRGHTEEITVDGEADPVAVKLDIWLSNTKSRKNRLTADQRDTLAELGINWT